MCVILPYVFIDPRGIHIMVAHRFHKRLIKERDLANTQHGEILNSPIEFIEGFHKWMVSFNNGVHVVLSMPRDYPFDRPRVKFINFRDDNNAIKSLCESDWYCAKRLDIIIQTLHAEMEKVRVIRAGRGILLCAPMMMLWRKRATERLYHPSKIDFDGELRELNTLLR